MYIGIDPGKTGAVAILDDKGNYINVLDFGQEGLMPTLIDYAPVVKFAYLEKVHSMPGQGVVSTFSFGENFGWWQGVLGSLGIPYTTIRPQDWMKKYSLQKSSASDKPGLEVARKLFPEAPLRLKKHHNRADALLIARACWEDIRDEDD